VTITMGLNVWLLANCFEKVSDIESFQNASRVSALWCDAAKFSNRWRLFVGDWDLYSIDLKRCLRRYPCSVSSMYHAFTEGHLSVVKWIFGDCALPLLYFRVLWVKLSIELNDRMERADLDPGFLLACKRGHLDMAKWWLQTFGLKGDEHSIKNYALKSVCKYGHLHVAKWLQNTFDYKKERFVQSKSRRLACLYGHEDVANWLLETFHLSTWR